MNTDIDIHSLTTRFSSLNTKINHANDCVVFLGNDDDELLMNYSSKFIERMKNEAKEACFEISQITDEIIGQLGIEMAEEEEESHE